MIRALVKRIGVAMLTAARWVLGRCTECGGQLEVVIRRPTLVGELCRGCGRLTEYHVDRPTEGEAR